MNRHKLLTCGALILSTLALALTMSAPTRTAEAAGPAFAPVTAVPLYRFFQYDYGFHFYTADPDERAALKGHSEWSEEQPQGYVFRQYVPGTVPLYRLTKVSPVGGTQHFYTLNPAEVDSAKGMGWKNEGVACFVSPTQVAGTVPLYRLYRPLNGDELESYQEDVDDGKFLSF